MMSAPFISSRQSESVQPERVVFIGGVKIALKIARALGDAVDVIAFSTLEELDRWRSSQSRPGTIERDITQALHDLGTTMQRLPGSIRAILETVSLQPSVPTVRQIEEMFPSRRSFYRAWSREISEPPSRFLRRVRAMHARRLLATGMTQKQAAIAAGFSSADRMRRHLSPTTTRHAVESLHCGAA